MLSWNAKKEDFRTARLIASRASQLDPSYSVPDALMDIIASHVNDCPLRLDELLNARDFDFAHDVFGIRRFLDRATGRLKGAFRPRFSITSNPASAVHDERSGESGEGTKFL